MHQKEAGRWHEKSPRQTTETLNLAMRSSSLLIRLEIQFDTVMNPNMSALRFLDITRARIHPHAMKCSLSKYFGKYGHISIFISLISQSEIRATKIS